MKKLFITIIVVGGVVWAGGYFLYTFYFPRFVAQAIVSETKSPYLPKRILNKIEGIRGPINKSSENIIRGLKKENVPMTKVYEAIDNTTEEEVYQMLDELNKKDINTPNEIFDVLVRHIHPDFDLEKFRKTFNENVTPANIKRLMLYANMNRTMKEVDMNTAKQIVKQILREKELDMQSKKQL